MKHQKKGFTLIELLVVIAIIGLLTSIVFASISSARDKAEVAKAKVQVKEIQKALELSRLSNNSLPVSRSASLSLNDLTQSTTPSPIKEAIEEYYGGDIPEVPSILAGDVDREYYYISNGLEAIDQYDVGYACGESILYGSEPDDAVIFFRDKTDAYTNKLHIVDGASEIGNLSSFIFMDDVAVNNTPFWGEFGSCGNDCQFYNLHYFSCIKL